tara:strand:- start:419 stop:634 length:216 start_codon:yes stop_codon:yes gene_type:complete
MNTDRHWVVVQFRSGTIKLWRDYDDGGMTWGSPAYAVLGYITGGYTAARRYVRDLPTNGGDDAIDDFDVIL